MDAPSLESPLPGLSGRKTGSADFCASQAQQCWQRGFSIFDVHRRILRLPARGKMSILPGNKINLECDLGELLGV